MKRTGIADPQWTARERISDTTAMILDEAKRQITGASHFIHGRGWVPATSGNFSMRLADGNIAITASGRDKGRLTPADVMRIDANGNPQEAQKPSAETGLHLALYSRDAAINAVLHTHSVNATICSMQYPAGLRVQGLEILKAFPGIHTHDTRVDIPVFANNQDIRTLADTVEEHMRAHGQGHAYLIAGHGLYTWGADMDECLRCLEALEYLFEYHRLVGPKQKGVRKHE